ncbi:helix-turn-helix domain-containing protein, partial [Pontibacter harenae]|uniref:helix-turn-helix domain-containing protein n=1 Tax=Pontibacter harenae TaxID=2894083 RepID=UPI0034E1D1C6
ATEKARTAKVLFDAGNRSVGEIAKILGIGRATCYRYIDGIGDADKDAAAT